MDRLELRREITSSPNLFGNSFFHTEIAGKN
jgi:hypothetical protein